MVPSGAERLNETSVNRDSFRKALRANRNWPPGAVQESTEVELKGQEQCGATFADKGIVLSV